MGISYLLVERIKTIKAYNVNVIVIVKSYVNMGIQNESRYLACVFIVVEGPGPLYELWSGWVGGG